jgi:hypothetical protein
MAISVHHMFFSVLSVKSNIAQTTKQIIEVKMQEVTGECNLFVLPQVAVEGVDVKMASCLASILPASRCLLFWPVQTPEWRI